MSCVSLHALELVNCRKIRFRSKNSQKLAFFCSKSAKWARFTITFLQKCDSKFFQLSTNLSPRILLQMDSFKVQNSSTYFQLFIFEKKSGRNFDQASRIFYQDAVFQQKSPKKVKKSFFSKVFKHWFSMQGGSKKTFLVSFYLLKDQYSIPECLKVKLKCTRIFRFGLYYQCISSEIATLHIRNIMFEIWSVAISDEIHW